MNKESTSPSTVYYRNSRTFTFVIGGFMILVAIYQLFTLLSSPQGIQSFIFPITLLILGIFLVYSAQQIRLVLSSKGIDYYQVGYTIRTTWDNIERIGEVRAGRVMTEAFILRKPVIEITRPLAWIDWFKQRGQWIPLSLFIKEWRDAELGQDIRKYAPHLL